jgi:hypothetical protein
VHPDLVEVQWLDLFQQRLLLGLRQELLAVDEAVRSRWVV